MPLEWTHETCAEDCPGTTDCPNFPTIKDRIDMADAAYAEYSESDGTPAVDFLSDVLLFVAATYGNIAVTAAINRFRNDWNAELSTESEVRRQESEQLLGQIARMTREEETDGGMRQEDAAATLNDLISSARRITDIDPGHPRVYCPSCGSGRCDCHPEFSPRTPEPAAV